MNNIELLRDVATKLGELVQKLEAEESNNEIQQIVIPAQITVMGETFQIDLATVTQRQQVVETVYCAGRAIPMGPLVVELKSYLRDNVERFFDMLYRYREQTTSLLHMKDKQHERSR